MTEKSNAAGRYTLPSGVKITARIKKEHGRYFAIVRGPGGTFETEHTTHKAADRKLASRLRALGATRRSNPAGVGLARLDGDELEAIAGKRTRNPARAPVPSSKLADLSEHGHVLDLVVRQGGKLTTYKFGRGHPLLAWSPEAKALVWWQGVKMPPARRVNPGELPAKAAATWERFHGAAPSRMRVANVPDPGPWKRIGSAVRIGYRNPKRWGKRDAEHDFTTGPVVYRAGTRAPYLWIVRGGNLRMTARGIEG